MDIDAFVAELNDATRAYEDIYFSTAKVATTYKAGSKSNAKLIYTIFKEFGIDVERKGKKLILRSMD